MTKANVKILGMKCMGCVSNVEKKLHSLNGVESAKVYLASQSAEIEYDETLISIDTMKQSIAEIGFEMKD